MRSDVLSLRLIVAVSLATPAPAQLCQVLGTAVVEPRESQPYPLDLVAAGGRIVAVGMIRLPGWETACGAWASTDGGRTWIATTLPRPQNESICIVSRVTWGNGVFVAVGDGGEVYSSPDGVAWARQAAPALAYTDVLWDGGRFVAFGGGGGAATSPDGRAWTSVPGTPGGMLAFAWNGTRYVGVGQPSITYSEDLQHWTRLDPPVEGRRWRDVEWGATRFVATGVGAWYLSSEDGVAWTAHEAGESIDLEHLLFTGNEFISAGYGGLYVLSRGNDWRWEPLTAAAGWSRLAWTGRELVGVTGSTPAEFFRAGCASDSILVPSLAHLRGVGGVEWRSDLVVHNRSAVPSRVLVERLDRDSSPAEPEKRELTLPPGASVRSADALLSLFGAGGAATFRLTAMVQPFVASARTFAETPAGTYGQFIAGVSNAEAIVAGQEARLIQLSQSFAAGVGFRTNVGLVNAGSVGIDVEVRLHRADGTLLGSRTYRLRPYESIQRNEVFREVTNDDVEDGYAVLETATPGGRFLAYASVVDNGSDDPSFQWAR